MTRFISLSLLIVCLVLASAKPPTPGKGAKKEFGIVMPAPNVKQRTPLKSAPSKAVREIEIDNFGTAVEGAFDMYQGDIKLTDEQVKRKTNNGKNKRSIVTASRKWTGGVIPYTFATYSGRTFTTDQQNGIRAAMDLITLKTGGCIKFVPRTTQGAYLSIINGDGCWSYIGQIYTASPQQLSLQYHSGGSCLDKGTIVHELMHATAVHHEQTRQDRDSYVTINYQNMNSAYYSQFDKVSGNYYNTLYDYYSIMHYSAYSFSSNGLPTIVPTDPTVVLLNTWQKSDAQIMTDSDILAIQRFYQCAETVNQATTVSTTTVSTTTVSTTTVSTTTVSTTTTVAAAPTSFRIRNNLSGYTVYIYKLTGDTLYYQYSIRSGRNGPNTSTLKGQVFYAITSDYVYYTSWTAGQGFFSTSGATVSLSSMTWYLY